MRRLTKPELGALLVADRCGEVRPSTKDTVDVCNRLAAYELLREYDSAPGVFVITSAGEVRLAQALARSTA